MKKNNNKHIIWSNMNLNLDDWKEGLLENRELNDLPTDVSDEVLEEEMYEFNNYCLDDERSNLNITPTNGRIIAIADLGLWDGRKMGYKLLDYDIGDCLDNFSQAEKMEFYCDRYNLRSTQIHHDGVNQILFRELRPNISSDQADNFTWKIYNGEVTSKDITRYTRSLRPYIHVIYGW